MKMNVILKFSLAIVLCIGIIYLVLVLPSYIYVFYWHREDAKKIDAVYTQFRNFMVESNRAGAYELFTPEYRTRRRLQDFGEKFEFVKEPDYELRPTRYLNIYKHTALMIPWKGNPAYGSGAGFEFSKVGTNWFLTGELTRFSD